MILFQLLCHENHPFESWFQNSEAFDKLAAARQVTCPHCNSRKVRKAMMAPALASGAAGQEEKVEAPQDPAADLRTLVEKNSEYVGMQFVSEVRKMQKGQAPERSVYGEARTEDALRLLEDGIRVAPLPFTPTRKMN